MLWVYILFIYEFLSNKLRVTLKYFYLDWFLQVYLSTNKYRLNFINLLLRKVMGKWCDYIVDVWWAVGY